MSSSTVCIEGEQVKKRKRKKPVNWGAVTFVVAHMIIPVLMVVIFYFYCNFESFFMAFRRVEHEKVGWSLYNFKWFFRQFGAEGTLMKEAFLNTLMWWGIQMFLVVFGVFTAYFIYKKIVGYKVFKVVFLIPGLVSAVVMTYMVQSMLGPSSIITKWVMGDHYTGEYNLLTNPKYAKTWLIIKSFPFAVATNMLIWVGSMSRIPESVIESAKLDGAGWLTEMFRIVIPMILTAVGITLCSNISGLFTANGGEFLYTQGRYGTMTLNTWLYLQIYRPTTNSHYQAAAVGWIMTIIIAPIIMVTRHFMNKLGEVEY
jgi:ABC-type sugar transport system permease subunit